MSDIDRNAFRDFERNAHDRLADTYHAFFAPVTEHAAEPLLTAAKVGARTAVLDVACGSGVVAKHAARRGALVTGIDLAPRMLELAAKLNPDCTFRESSVDSMPFDNGAFDAVVCAFGIGHFPDPPAAVAECARVTRAGSMCAFAWWDLPARNRMHGVLRPYTHDMKFCADSYTATHVRNRIFDLRCLPRPLVRFIAGATGFNLERGMDTLLSSEWNTWKPYPKPGSNGSWASKPLRVVGVSRMVGSPLRYSVAAVSMEK